MQPTIPDGSLVTVARKRFYWPGDVLIFASAEGRLTAHRLVGACRWRGRLRLFTRADNAPRMDAAILASDVVGRVVGAEGAPSVARIPLARRFGSFAFFLRCALSRVFRRSESRSTTAS
jgi:hypothetical protein